MECGICGANCAACQNRETCPGCAATGGSPFGGRCVAASYIKAGGMEQYKAFRAELLEEINALLRARDLPPAETLYELPGAWVNLAYPLPSGDAVRLLDDKNIYLGCQIEFGDLGVCYGVVADAGFILICSYSVNGSEPELIAYQKR